MGALRLQPLEIAVCGCLVTYVYSFLFYDKYKKQRKLIVLPF
jgi:hypothetical protein